MHRWKSKCFATKSRKVVAEKNKTIAKLDDEISGTCFISTKAKLPNNIQAMDQETWNEIGVLLKELTKKMEEKDVCHNFIFKAWLGEESILKWEESKTFSVFNNYSKSEFLVGLFPRYKLQRWWLSNKARPNDNKFSRTMENERIAIKLRPIIEPEIKKIKTKK